ncbi:hypothetical protein GCM10010435_74270 [Winogradskya consettensis]|uniref:Tetracyclin repressor-like C-terminal domain-containing protein n=1 Tax=Winogradskya consettensis TaxID=113560 RepID=A0A919SNZ4_9ACTN|nr:hypothetical protein [Actinoplanes consettensis]GIM75036.1 hypothetical protein Aco04nite_43310 [Actinoplanes consettensis]
MPDTARTRFRLDGSRSEAPLRFVLVATQIAGPAVVRYVLEVEPVASAPAEQLVATAGPNVRRYLTGDL